MAKREHINVERRKLLKVTSQGFLGACCASAFGLRINDVLAADTLVVIIYATKYGATRDTAQWIAQGLQRKVQIVNLEQVGDLATLAAAGTRFVLGSAVFQEAPMHAMQQFVQHNRSVLSGRVAASFVVCGTEPNSEKNKQRIASFITKLNQPLQEKPDLVSSFGGRLQLEKLTQQDLAALTRFYQKILKKKLQSWDRTEPEQAKAFGKLLGV